MEWYNLTITNDCGGDTLNIIVKTPFKSDGLETDPMVYGLRPSELMQGITQLYNDKSLLITGSRGIGKSSLCYQLQQIMQGDKTILNRCALDISMHKFITINYICTPDDTLETIVYSILNELERELVDCNKKYNLKVKEFDVQIFGFLKAKIENKSNEKEQFVTLVNSFVEVIHSFRETYVDPHINISLDELDQINPEYNIAHFIKAVLEQLDKKGDERFLSFILVGQNCLYNLLYDKQPAFHRLVKHIRLFPLDEENSSYVLDACLKRANICTEILDDAKICFLRLTNGYPYFIQLLGDETFNAMLSRYVRQKNLLTIKLEDVLSGLKNVIICEQQRYEILLEELDDNIKSCILTLASKKVINPPFRFNLKNIEEGLLIEDSINRNKEAKNIVQILINKQVLQELDGKINEDKEFCFQEEIFRVYLFDRINNVNRLSFDD